MLDDWMYDQENGEDSVILILDQSAAYNLISHKILLRKLEILRFDPHAVGYYSSYLKNMSQKVVIDTFTSDKMYI